MPKYDKITPEGTRDMLFLECDAQNRIRENLKEIFENKAYREVKTPGFEFYDVFSSKARYYPQESVYMFSDAAGRMVTVRPDSTIPIARMTATKLKGHELPIRLWYAQRVYRQQQALRGRSGEIMQMGVELIGASTFASDIEILTMAAESLRAASREGCRMEIGHVGIYNLLVDRLDASAEERELIHRYVAAKNYARVSDVLERFPADKTTEILRQLPRLFGTVEALKQALALCNGYDPKLTEMMEYLEKLFEGLRERGLENQIMLDFGLINQEEYYSSLVFRGYIEDTGAPVLSGGRYDQLFRNFGEDLPATGFALNLDLLTASVLRRMDEGRADEDRAIRPVSGRQDAFTQKASVAAGDHGSASVATGDHGSASVATGDYGSASVSVGDHGSAPCEQPEASPRRLRRLRIALTKGRLEDSFVRMMEKAGYDTSVIGEKGRKLLLSIPGTDIELFLAKAPDVITYVEHGVCDIGIVGKDTIAEQGGTFYEILDLGIGKCRFALAAPAGRDFYSGFGTKVIATKYPAVAGRFFEGKGMDVEIIKIEGSVELAPILSLADGIVDIVETGRTLRENGLAVIEEIRNVSARFIVNVTSMKLKKEAIDDFANRLESVVRSED